MKFEIRTVDQEKGIVQITTTDERWYRHIETFYPSITWITSYYPKGKGFEKWLADKGWDEAEMVKNEAGLRGSRVHHAIAALLTGQEIKMDMPFTNADGEPMALTADEWGAVMTFVDWHRLAKPTSILVERSGINLKEGYGGTLDFLCAIEGELWLIDFKTSANIYRSHEMQLSALKRILPFIEETKEVDIKTVKTAILQVGYKKTKKGYKFTPCEDKFDLFLHAKAIWEEEVAYKFPPQKDYPLTLKI
jgi:hypothetical protein